MNVLFDRSFSKSLDKITDQTLKERIAILIEAVEHAATLREITGIKKMEGHKTFHRIRLGDYRVGIELESATTVRFIIVAHRKDIYKLFP